MTHVGNGCVIVAAPENPLTRRGCGGSLAEALHDIADIAVGRGADIDSEQGGAKPDHMIVRLDKAGQHGEALGMHMLRLGCFEG